MLPVSIFFTLGKNLVLYKSDNFCQWTLTFLELTDRFGFSSIGGTDVVWEHIGNKSGKGKRRYVRQTCKYQVNTKHIYLHKHPSREYTYTGSVRFPTSSEARSALTGFPGCRSIECLSKVCSTVPPLFRSLSGTEIFRHNQLWEETYHVISCIPSNITDIAEYLCYRERK